MKDRTIDLDLLLDHWSGATAPSGFADRVLGALDKRPAQPARARVASPPRRAAWLAAGALAAAMVLVPLFVSRSARPSATAPVAAITPDLGLDQD